MNWTTPDDLEAQLLRRWERGDLPRMLVTAESGFPLLLSLKSPVSSDLVERFDTVRTWAAELAAARHLRIEWRQVSHRVQGRQRIPAQAWVDTMDDAVALIGKRDDAERLARIVALTASSMPELVPWLARHALRAVALAEQWARLIAVVQWMRDHPRPRIYLRQVDVPGVHSKFIETHRGVLSELFDLVLPPRSIESGEVGIGQFSARYGFLHKEARIRFRVLDAEIDVLPGIDCPDITLNARSFADLAPAATNVFITENETNFLAFPRMRGAIVIFGAGYGWDGLAAAGWLDRCAIRYWGDIDTHGFAILDQLRSRFAHVSSFLMDRDTLMAHEAHWGEERERVPHDLQRLTEPERALFDALRDNAIRPNLRLEQERVEFHWLVRALSSIPNAMPADADDPTRPVQ